MNLKELRKSKGLSMEQLASIFGCTRQSIYNYESGDREPSLETLKKYCSYFNVSLDDITSQTEVPLFESEPISFEKLKPIKVLTPKDEMEQQLLERFRSLSFDDKLKAINYITNLIK